MQLVWENVYFAHQTSQFLALLFILLYFLWGELLRRARKARGWSAERAVEELNNTGGRNIDVRTYLSWERGERQPRPLNQLALKRIYPENNSSPKDFVIEDFVIGPAPLDYLTQRPGRAGRQLVEAW
jgi:transcriptional regulator with XRE-family HTH domain